MTTKPFPAITGRCHCGKVKYRLLTSPLFCYACHCPDCQKLTGSAFALHASIETYNISIISEAKPSLVKHNIDPLKPEDQDVSTHALCQQCGTVFWGNDNQWKYAVSHIRIGTLDFPDIMEPDLHAFIGSKLGWLSLPKDAKTTKGRFDYRQVWPKSSLDRLEVCLERFEAANKATAADKPKDKQVELVELVVREKDESPVDRDGDKTPTATGDAEDGEDDEAFEARFNETERILHERLAKLNLKLEDEEKQATSSTAT